MSVRVGDEVRFRMPVDLIRSGTVMHRDGGYISIAINTASEGWVEIERYDTECYEIVSRDNPLPWTRERLERTKNLAAPEPLERQKQRYDAQLELQRAISAGELRFKPGSWEIERIEPAR